MARIRSVHPEICLDDTLAAVSARAERTFVRLWPHLDDEGRAVDNPKLLKAALYPLHDDVSVADVDRDLDELADAMPGGLVIRYSVNGRDYLSAKPEAWRRWQKPRHRYESKFPPPDHPDAMPRRTRVGPPSDDHAMLVPDPLPDDTKAHPQDTPSDVSPTSNGRAPAGEEGRVVVDVEELAAAANVSRAELSPAVTPAQRQQRIHQAVELLTDRHLARTPSKSNPTRHRASVHRGKLRDHHELGHQHLIDDPQLTPELLADLLEPPPVAVTPTDRPDPLAGQREALLARAEEGMATVRAITAEPRDVELNVTCIADARANLRQPGAPT